MEKPKTSRLLSLRTKVEKRMNLNRTIEERDFINKEFKFFNVAHLRQLEKMHSKGEISYSRMVELINEKAYDFYIRNKKLS